MPQLRLENFFRFPATSTSTRPGLCFLDLPFHARRRVYEYAGLTDNFIDLNVARLPVFPRNAYPETRFCTRLCTHEAGYIRRLDVNASEEAWEFVDDDDYPPKPWCECHEIPYQLLFVSKQISKEVHRIIYKENQFRVSRGYPNGLKRLTTMGKRELAALVSLTIRLDIEQETVYFPWEESHRRYCSDIPTPVDIKSRQGRDIVQDWKAVVERLSHVINPNTLKLYLIFCAVDHDTVKSVLEPMAQLPVLEHCGIWVRLLSSAAHSNDARFYGRHGESIRTNSSQSRVVEVDELVQQTISQLTASRMDSDRPFRYLDLPQELRSLILEYTELVSLKDVQWRPQTSIQPLIKTDRTGCICNMDPEYTNIEDTGTCVCGYAEVERNQSNWRAYNIHLLHTDCCGKCRPENASHICFCSRNGSLSSTSCICQRPRHPFFSVSRQTREDAIPIYYSQNKIVVTPHCCPMLRSFGNGVTGPWLPNGFLNMPKIELSLYLSSIARNALKNIRWLEWILPSFRSRYLSPKAPAWHDYLDTLKMMEHAMNLPKLTLVINLEPREAHRFSQEHILPFEDILLPLSRLRGLKDCFVYLRPRSWRLKPEEVKLEKIVMGSEYNSSQREKPRERLALLFEQHLLAQDY